MLSHNAADLRTKHRQAYKKQTALCHEATRWQKKHHMLRVLLPNSWIPVHSKPHLGCLEFHAKRFLENESEDSAKGEETLAYQIFNCKGTLLLQRHLLLQCSRECCFCSRDKAAHILGEETDRTDMGW